MEEIGSPVAYPPPAPKFLIIKAVSDREFLPSDLDQEIFNIKDLSQMRGQGQLLRHIDEILQPIADRLRGILARTAATEENHHGIDAKRLREMMLPSINQSLATMNRITEKLGLPRPTSGPDAIEWLAKQCDRLKMPFNSIIFTASLQAVC